jgi:AcrR family transcriptional regulator
MPSDMVTAQKSQSQSNGTRHRDAEQTRADILEAAKVEFADKGLAGARVDEIARLTSTSKHMIYYYFQSKEGLYRAVLEQAYAHFRSAEETVDANQSDPVAALTSLVGLTFDFRLSNPAYVRIIMAENMNNGTHIKFVGDLENRRVILKTIKKIVDNGIAAGKFRSDINVLQLHMTISGLAFFYVSNRYTFGHIFGVDLADAAMIATRRQHIIDAVLSICLARD